MFRFPNLILHNIKLPSNQIIIHLNNFLTKPSFANISSKFLFWTYYRVTIYSVLIMCSYCWTRFNKTYFLKSEWIWMVNNQNLWKKYTIISYCQLYYTAQFLLSPPALVSIHPVLLSSIIYLPMGVSLLFVNILTKSAILSSNNSMSLIFLVGLFGGVLVPILYFIRLDMTNASSAAVLINAEFLSTVILAFIFLKEKVTMNGVVGIVCIFIGLLVLDFSESHIFINFQDQNFLGNLLIISSTVFLALDNTISKIILVRGVSIRTLLQLKSLIDGSISWIVAIVLNISLNFRFYDIPSLLFLSLGGFAGSLFLFMVGLKEVGAIKSVMKFSTSSFFGIIFAILLGEKVSLPELTVALGFVLVGIFLITRESE